MGENLAARLRTSLFSSLLQQDIEFFDMHKTGELIDRYFIHFINQTGTSLFSSLLQQDIEFFDRHKTGELIDRYFIYTFLNNCLVLYSSRI